MAHATTYTRFFFIYLLLASFIRRCAVHGMAYLILKIMNHFIVFCSSRGRVSRYTQCSLYTLYVQYSTDSGETFKVNPESQKVKKKN